MRAAVADSGAMSHKRRMAEGEEGEAGQAKLQRLDTTDVGGEENGTPGVPLSPPVHKQEQEEEKEEKEAVARGGVSPRLAPATRISKRGISKKKKGGKQHLSHTVDDAISEAEDGNSKRRRTWELWGPSEKLIFFEALNEYGKDFDKIQSHFQAKLKNKRNLPAYYIKNKNQIRHFYYRTWHKISTHITFKSELTKNSKELIGLINYGELWKKIGGTVDDKFGQKLDDLVRKGTAALKVKGKSQRVKTPVCRALKKVHSKGEPQPKPQSKPKLPSKVLS